MPEPRPTDARPWPASDTVTCPNCQTELTYYDPNSSYYGCPGCQAFFNAEQDKAPVILYKPGPDKVETTPRPIGMEGYLRGHWVRVVGYMLRQEKGTTYQWREYMLLLKDGSTRQLAEYNGHWMWIEPATETYRRSSYAAPSFVLDDDDSSYPMYGHYQPEIITAIGEFDWNILDDESLTVDEFISPPRMLINEWKDGRNDWYQADYLPMRAMETAFGLKPGELAEPAGVGAIQPNPFERQWVVAKPVALIATVVAICIHLGNIMTRPSGTLMREELSSLVQFPPSDSANAATDVLADPAAQRAADSVRIAQLQPTPPLVSTRSFTITGPTAIDIDFSTDVDNTWIEFGTELVEEQTNERYYFTKTAEYYHGYSSGSNWNEGNKEASATLSRIQSGTYHLEIRPYTQFGQEVPFTVIVGQNMSLFSNVLVAIGLLLIYPIYLLWRSLKLESARWLHSDFGPDD